MPIALSTLGLPGRPLAEVLDLAAEHGWQGLELRCAPGEPVHPALDPGGRRAVRAACAAAGITPLAVASYLGVAAPGPDRPLLAALAEHLRLAADLGAPYLRVFPRGGDGPVAGADRRAVRRLTAAAGQAAALGVRILVETHDSHRGGRDLARVLAQVGQPAVGALWDLLHTRLAGEKVRTTADSLAPYLGYVQVKDVADAHDLTPLALGAGCLPITDCLRTLPDGCWVSWEYEAPWHPAAAPLPGLLGPAADLLRSLRPAQPPPQRPSPPRELPGPPG
ncbi:sugar phosphate isomerase/epimerase family protein [Kitasatospora sp. NPDC094015]|uniref:sugar phosphate isomerase/epimerase family protein n=1 Tax=Kitasatospora sp. NPDC094015 TaxID=3155205 RepID=UPI003328C4E2